MRSLLFLALLLWPLPVFAAEQGWSNDPERSAWFKSLKQPSNGISCCDVSDCRRTEAEWRDGQWWAVVPRYNRKEWEPIPPDVVLPTKSIDEFAYVCNGPGHPASTGYTSGGSKPYPIPAFDGKIFCFVPPFNGF